MEKDPAPPPGGATDSKNPDEKPRAFQMDSESTSTPHPKTLTVADLQAPTEGFSFFDTPTPNPEQDPVDTPTDNPLTPPPLQTGIPHHNTQVIENTDSPVVNPAYTGEDDVTMAIRPQTP